MERFFQVPQKHEASENLPDVEVFTADGRLPLEQLYAAYDALLEAGWSKELVTMQAETLPDGTVIQWPIYAYKSHPNLTEPTESFFCFGGVHGEEPASSNAFAQAVPSLIEFAAQGTPVVFLPMLNPSGYHRNWRYQNERRNYLFGKSVTDCDHLVPDPANPNTTRIPEATSPAADAIPAWVLEQSQIYKPYLVIDHHEDEFDVSGEHQHGDHTVQQYETYLYFHGKPEYVEVAEQVARILDESGLELVAEGTTRFGEQIHNGVVKNSPDGSIEDLLAETRYFKDGQWHEKYPTPCIVVVETSLRPYPDESIPLERRVRGHRAIVEQYPQLWAKLKELDVASASSLTKTEPGTRLAEIVQSHAERLAIDFQEKARAVYQQLAKDFVVEGGEGGEEVLLPVEPTVDQSVFKTKVIQMHLKNLLRYSEDGNGFESAEKYAAAVMNTFRGIVLLFPERIAQYFQGYTVTEELGIISGTSLATGTPKKYYYADGSIERYQDEIEPLILQAVGK